MNTKSEKVRSSGYGERLKEITAVLHKHAITRGISGEVENDSGGPWTDIYQAGSDYVVEIRYFAEAILR